MTKLTKEPILPNCHVPNGYFCISYKLFTIVQILAAFIFVSVSLMWENVTGLRENIKHKIRSLDLYTPHVWSPPLHFYANYLGQLISEGNFGVFKFPKKLSKLFEGFLS